jgi:hypothetical protein
MGFELLVVRLCYGIWVGHAGFPGDTMNECDPTFQLMKDDGTLANGDLTAGLSYEVCGKGKVPTVVCVLTRKSKPVTRPMKFRMSCDCCSVLGLYVFNVATGKNVQPFRFPPMKSKTKIKNGETMTGIGVECQTLNNNGISDGASVVADLHLDMTTKNPSVLCTFTRKGGTSDGETMTFRLWNGDADILGQNLVWVASNPVLTASKDRRGD